MILLYQIHTPHYAYRCSDYHSQVQDANVLVFPNLGSANTAYKLLSRLGGAEAIGPILVGMGKPIQIVETGASVRDIVNLTTMAVIEAHLRSG